MKVDDPKLQNILEQLKHFGFEFFGYGENEIPLVKGPNEQVVEINIAINFVNEKIKEQKEQDSIGSPEQPHIPENLDANQNVESSVERKIETTPERENSIEKKTQEKPSQKPELNVQKKAPQVKLDKKENRPYGDGFDPKSFNPSDLNSTLQFVEKHSKGSKTSSNKWLAEQFKKFVMEFKASSSK